MPAATTDVPAVALSFANNFWGKDDAGVGPLLERMQGAKQTCDELRSFYGARASIEDEYARKLLNLSRKSLGSQESGTLKTSLDTVRGELEAMGKQHQSIAAQMKTELEEPLAAFAGGMKERRKIVQSTVEKLLKTKIQQTQQVNKTRDKYEQECLKIKGYLAQGHMVMGQEERRNKAKLEKTQISLATSNTEYENSIKALEDTTARWNREWKAAADKFQDLEEERLDFTKSSLWTFANIASTVCVSDDASCEKIRLSLETMDVEKDIVTFITDQGTGQEIPDPPKYINFCRGDINDSQSEASEDDNYSVAQFPRSINPAFRSSSPQPSTFESHHDPNSALAKDLAHRHSPMPTREVANRDMPNREIISRDVGSRDVAAKRDMTKRETATREMAPRDTAGRDIANRDMSGRDLTSREMASREMANREMASREMANREMASREMANREMASREMANREMVNREMAAREMAAREMASREMASREMASRELANRDMINRDAAVRDMPNRDAMGRDLAKREMHPAQRAAQPMPMSVRPSLEEQRPRQQAPAQLQYDVAQHGPVASVPFDPYPMDGMTMLCRTGPPSDLSSNVTSARPSSRESHSDYATSFSSQEPPSGKTSPVKQDPAPVTSPEKRVLKKKSGFFQNHSPFRRKSQKEAQTAAQPNRNTWHAASHQSGSPTRRPQLYQQEQPQERNLLADRTASPEPIDANASLALGVGQNVLPITTRDIQKATPQPAKSEVDESDPIALALAELKGVTLDKQSSVRMSADRYHGISTPAPSADPALSRSVPVPGSRDAAASSRGTPPPSYQQQGQVSRLGVPPPAVTSRAMKEATKKATTQTRSVFGDSTRSDTGVYSTSPVSRPGTRGNDVPRAASPAPARSASPQPSISSDARRSGHRSASPNPYNGHEQRNSSYSSVGQGRNTEQGHYHHASPAGSVRGSVRGASPAPYGSQYSRPKSSYAGSEMAVQLAPAGDDDTASQRSRNGSVHGSIHGSVHGSVQGDSRAMGLYDPSSRQRSQSVADPARQYTRDGRAILHYARALYVYQAAIPEELGFAKGDYLAVLRHQDDGWWEAEVHGSNGRVGLVPSNYLQPSLLGLASVASVLFFKSFLPDQVSTVPIHLQYGASLHPYGVISLTGRSLKTQQDYDLAVTISMPRSPANVERGNFMVNLSLLDADVSTLQVRDARQTGGRGVEFDDRAVVFNSRRPVLLPYVDPMVSWASRVLFLLYHIFLEKSDTCTLTIPLAERVVFSRTSRVPSAAYVEVEAGQTIQIYSAVLTVTAQLRGLRWLMFHYRLTMYVVLTFSFWACEVLFMVLAWTAWVTTMSPISGTGTSTMLSTKHKEANVKTENTGDEDEMEEPGNVSDRPHVFPTYGRQPPLKHDPQVKREADLERSMAEIPVAGAEADDEDEDDVEYDPQRHDSGLGTSYSEEGSSSNPPKDMFRFSCIAGGPANHTTISPSDLTRGYGRGAGNKIVRREEEERRTRSTVLCFSEGLRCWEEDRVLPLTCSAGDTHRGYPYVNPGQYGQQISSTSMEPCNSECALTEEQHRLGCPGTSGATPSDATLEAHSAATSGWQARPVAMSLRAGTTSPSPHILELNLPPLNDLAPPYAPPVEEKIPYDPSAAVARQRSQKEVNAVFKYVIHLLSLRFSGAWDGTDPERKIRFGSPNIPEASETSKTAPIRYPLGEYAENKSGSGGCLPEVVMTSSLPEVVNMNDGSHQPFPPTEAMSTEPKIPTVTPLHLLGDQPDMIDCPFCLRRTETKVVREASAKTHILATVCCLTTVFGVIVPYILHWSPHIEQHCTNCNRRVTRKPYGKDEMQIFGTPPDQRMVSRFPAAGLQSKDDLPPTPPAKNDTGLAEICTACLSSNTMPCFKGLAVSIHANSAPLPEHGMQKQSRLSRISTYIPVPQPELSGDSNKPEPAKFAISITLLTPGLPVPYSTPKPSESNPYPKPQFVGGLQGGSANERNKLSGLVNPYVPMTNSENETIAAYIYFDGRAKEEVATLLRPGEETWVNSRWVQVPESEGGGLAEREFLFREVGLERWLNGLDLKGHDAAEKLEKRRQKFERRRRRQISRLEGNSGMDVESGPSKRRDTLRYGADDLSPIEAVFDDSDSWSSDEDDPPEATGQIKVAMFRVLASGEIKKGEYSPQFDAHDGDDEETNKDGGNLDADVEHTTSFAKPKTLDPKTISTQTVTTIDGPDKPYATFTFFYRGERQLQKIGVLQSSKNQQSTPGSAAKRRSGQLDFSNLGPLKAGGTVGFSAFRDQDSEAIRRRKARKKSNGNIADDSDEDDDDSEALDKMEELYDKDDGKRSGGDDAPLQGELAEGVDRIHLKRAHSADPDGKATPDITPAPGKLDTLSPAAALNLQSNPPDPSSDNKSADVPPEGLLGSPLKKARPSIDQTNSGDRFSAAQSLSAALGSTVSGTPPTAPRQNEAVQSAPKEEEEL
ncbi:Septation protein imp2 [Paramyrothecium foliicola]|nr:Septation protein imp2 [Paramyrothecium foliicola]